MKLSRGFKIIFLGLSFLVFLTGVVWFYLEKWVRVAGALGEDHHPLQFPALAVHGIASMFLLVAFGYLIATHVQPGLKKKKRKNSGLVMTTLFGILTVTAVGELYAGEGFPREAMGLIHLYVGLASPLLLAVHLTRRR